MDSSVDASKRFQAAVQLGETPAGLAFLAKAAESDEPFIRGTVAFSVRPAENEASIQILSKLLSDKDEEVLVRAIRNLRISESDELKLQPPMRLSNRVHNQLTDLLAAKSKRVQIEALKSVKSFHVKEDWPLVVRFSESPDIDIRRCFFDHLIRSYGLRAKNVLHRHLKDRDLDIRRECMDQLETIRLYEIQSAKH